MTRNGRIKDISVMRYISIQLFLFPILLAIYAAPLSAVSSNPAAPEPCTVKGVQKNLPGITLGVIAEGFVKPLHMTNAGDGSKRLFVVEQAGIIRTLKGAKVYPVPFLDIREHVRSGREMGLLSVAFHPNFNENKRFFVNYTSHRGGLHTVISEFKVGEKSDMADKESERIILKVIQPFSNHNGGQIAFGPDGYLYIGMGDGGSANDPYGHGQNLSTLLGAILRIDVDRKRGKIGYGVPDDNPFMGLTDSMQEIWAYGLRNPWRFSFDPLTGILYTGDVGQDDREEIDVIEPGKNYGWNVMEGSICTPGVRRDCNKTGLELPIAEYGRRDGISVIGGVVYRGHDMPALCGAYLYGDWGSGKIWALRYHKQRVIEQKLLLDTDLSISSFGIDENYEAYVVDHGGRLYRIMPASK
jgi:glucose/arabinose dehydrogenase